MRQIEHAVRLGPLAARVKHLNSDVMKVYDAATTDEKRQLDPIAYGSTTLCWKRERVRANIGIFIEQVSTPCSVQKC